MVAAWTYTRLCSELQALLYTNPNPNPNPHPHPNPNPNPNPCRPATRRWTGPSGRSNTRSYGSLTTRRTSAWRYVHCKCQSKYSPVHPHGGRALRPYL
eukprot:scaffold33790_cov60-Phaeocystis_antarctica.AAC.1